MPKKLKNLNGSRMKKQSSDRTKEQNFCTTDYNDIPIYFYVSLAYDYVNDCKRYLHFCMDILIQIMPDE